MEIRKATAEDFDIVFDFIEKLWTYNTYDREEIRKAEGCKAVTLNSGLPRTGAHGFYEHYGFEESCYGFELMI